VVANGLALCALHHALFDLGVLGLTAERRIRVSGLWRTSTPIRTWSPDSAIRRTWSRNAAPAERGTSGGSPDC
jgi:hypothetical protein